LAYVFRRTRNVRRPHRFVRFLCILLGLVIVRLLRQVIGTEAFRNQFAHLLQRIVRDVHGIGAHVGNQRDGAFLAKLHAFVEPLRQAHGALRGVAQAVVSSLLQLRRRERRRRVAPLFLLRYRSNLPLGLAHRRDDLVRRFLVPNLDVLALVLAQLGFKDGRLARVQHCVDRPILLRHKRAYQLFPLDNQAQRDRLHAPCGQSAPYLVPQQGRNFVAHDAVQHASRLLRVHQVAVHLPRLLKRRANRLRRNLVERHTENLFRVDRRNADFVAILFGGFGLALGIRLGFGFFFFFRFGGFVAVAGRFFFVFGGLGQHHRQVRRNRFAFAVRIARQIHRRGRASRFSQVINNLALARNNLQRRLKNLGVVQGDRFPVGFLGGCFALLALFLRLFIGQTDTNRFLG